MIIIKGVTAIFAKQSKNSLSVCFLCHVSRIYGHHPPWNTENTENTDKTYKTVDTENMKNAENTDNSENTDNTDNMDNTENTDNTDNTENDVFRNFSYWNKPISP